MNDECYRNLKKSVIYDYYKAVSSNSLPGVAKNHSPQ